MLHELKHLSFSFEDIPEHAAVINQNDDGVPQIDDSPDGDGPWNAYEINVLLTTGEGPHRSLQNADNFVWYAVAKYWAWKCGREFGPPRSEADGQKRPREHPP